MTEVSVIIPTCNRAKRICRAVSSVLDQTYTDFEVIIVDDASTDDTIERLNEFGDRIQVIKHPENKGVSAARNSGIKKSKGKYIALLDSDDYWMPEKLRIQTDFFNKNPDAVISQAREFWIRKGKRVNPAKKHLKPSGDIFIPSLKLCLVSPSAVMFRRLLLDEVGMFDEDFPVCEDYDLWLRISYKYPVHLIEQDLLVKEGGAPDQLSASMQGMDRFRIKSMVKLYKRGVLNDEQEKALLKELGKKCRVYGDGCIKRGKIEEGEYYLSLVKNLLNHEPH
ncbi:MAG: glycosyltransferase family A protein [Desulfobacteraceae bacterium]|jgi:glycosyltransferase involved in cell wall biosynthesis